jgi:glycosyltransferase involved in cell wall biosynthesis
MVVYDMGREAPRTLHSLSSGYQRGVSGDEYEVIVVDNGSPTPLGEAAVRRWGPQFRYLYVRDASPSPASAINLGVAASRGKHVCIMIDGARMVTPGLVANTLLAFRAYPDATVATLGWHLGPESQVRSVQKGYTKETEDALLRQIGWPADGYRLFEIGCLGGSSVDGCFRPLSESNTVALSRAAFDELCGYDTRFDLPGGGMVNLDFYKRACERPGSELVILPGEGCFHQLHGGTATNVSQAELSLRQQKWAEQYRAIRGTAWELNHKQAVYLGSFPAAALAYIGWSASRSLEMRAAADGR